MHRRGKSAVSLHASLLSSLTCWVTHVALVRGLLWAGVASHKSGCKNGCLTGIQLTTDWIRIQQAYVVSLGVFATDGDD